MDIDVTESSKELDAETSLYYGVYPPAGRSARYYDSWSGTWMSADPLSNKYPGWSPYNYVEDNPATSIDPNGKGWYETNSSNVPLYSPNINSQAELDKRVIGYTYLGKTAFTVNKQGYETFYNANGSSSSGIFMAPMQTITAIGNATSPLRPLDKLALSSDISLEVAKGLTEEVQNAQDFLLQAQAFEGYVNSIDKAATFASGVSAGYAFYKAIKHPSVRAWANFGIETVGFVYPETALPIGVLDILRVKQFILSGLSNARLWK